MRASFVFSEVITGLRRNVTMTIAMILTTAISLGLLGGGLLVVRLIDTMRANYGDMVEVNVNLTDDVSANDKNCSQQPCAGLLTNLRNNPLVASATFESRDQVYERFKKIFEAQPEMLQLTRPEALPAMIHVTPKDSSRSSALVQNYTGQPGVKFVDDQGVFLERFFGVLNGVRNATFAVALIQAVAALLLISNTIQVSAFTRRTEVGIMRLVGATRWYTQLPFLLEAMVAGLIGAVLAIGGLVGSKLLFVDKVLAEPIKSGIIPPVSGLDIVAVSPWLVLAALAISASTGYVTLRLYVRT